MRENTADRLSEREEIEMTRLLDRSSETQWKVYMYKAFIRLLSQLGMDPPRLVVSSFVSRHLGKRSGLLRPDQLLPAVSFYLLEALHYRR